MDEVIINIHAISHTILILGNYPHGYINNRVRVQKLY